MLQTLRVGDVEITYIPELTLPTSVRWMLPGADRGAVEACDPWMRPHYRNDDGYLVQSIHTLLVKTPGLVMLVDTGVGNGKARSGAIPAFNMLDTPWLDRLAEAGVQPQDVDVVLCTHLHADHCGWNTYLWDGIWAPTFPNARYYIVDEEWRYWSEQATQAGQSAAWQLLEDSVKPVFDWGLVGLVSADHQVSQGIRLVPSHGHTPGHVTVEIWSGGQSAALIGDVMHSPLQCAFPDLPPALDRDPEPARLMRRQVLARYADTDTLVLGAHFPYPAGRVVTDGDAWRYEAVEG